MVLVKTFIRGVAFLRVGPKMYAEEMGLRLRPSDFEADAA